MPKVRFQYFDERLEIAKSLGYNSIEDAIIQLYRKTGSARQTGKFFQLSPTSILRTLHVLGEKVKGRGGPNNKKQ